MITQLAKMTDLALEQQKDSVVFDVRVIPRSSKSEIVGSLDGALKVKLKSPPIDGAANEELIKLLSKRFSVPRSALEIFSVHTSKKKRLRLTGISNQQICSTLKAKS
jgi:uncharacterized protein (TIGR00251 family)